ncbi:MAG: YceI family protein [Planctomycetia bacterium]|nr:YceI family protein [Planctomycetia bacterium]
MKKPHHPFRILAICLGLIGFMTIGASRAFSESYAVDPVHSTVLFRIKHMETSFSWGRFNEIVGRLNLDDKAPSLEMHVKTESLDTANAKRDQHLKSPDFFSAKQFPTISFKSKRIARLGDTKYDVDGTLSLHGFDRPVKVLLERTGTSKNQQGVAVAGYATTFSIKRSDFGMKYLLEGLSDDVVLIVSLECAAQ